MERVKEGEEEGDSFLPISLPLFLILALAPFFSRLQPKTPFFGPKEMLLRRLSVKYFPVGLSTRSISSTWYLKWIPALIKAMFCASDLNDT